MALSGSFYTNVGSGWRLQLEWTGTQSIDGNYTDVTAKLYWMSLGSSYTVSSSATKTCSIYVTSSWDNKSASGMASLSGNQKKLIHTFTNRVNHNSDGTGSVTLDGWFDAEVTLSGTYYGRVNLTGTTFTLDTIPRASTMTSSASWTAGNNRTISISRHSTSFRHEVEIYVKRTDGAWDWIKRVDFSTSQTSLLTSFSVSEKTEIFQHMSQRSSCDSRMILQTFNGSTLIGENYYYGTVTNPSASTISSSPSSFDIGDMFSVSVSRNDGEFLHSLTMKNGSTSIKTYTDVGVSKDFYTGNISTELYNATPNSNNLELTLELITYYNGVQTNSATTKSITGKVTNSDPTISVSQISYLDVNATTTALTGNDQYIIQDKSQFRAKVNTPATANNGATIVGYDITIDGRTLNRGYNVGEVIATFNEIGSSSNATLSVKAIDSRGNNTTVTKTVSVVPYSPPVASVSAKRLNNFEDQTTVTLSGSISPISVDGVIKNSLKTATHAYKVSTDGTYSNTTSYGTMPTTTSYSFPDEVYILDKLNAWHVQIVVSDELTTVTVTKTVSTGQPILFVDSVKKSVGINMFPANDNSLEVGGNGVIQAKAMHGKYLNDYMIKDHNNGNVTLNALGGELYLGHVNTTKVRLSSALYDSGGSNVIIDSSGNFNLNNGMLISNDGGDLSGTNVDHVWHDDSANAWHFVSDGSANQEGNSRLIAGSIKLTSLNDATTTSTGHAFTIGNDTTGESLKIDTNEISSFNGGGVSSLLLNPDGGNVSFNNSLASNKRWLFSASSQYTYLPRYKYPNGYNMASIRDSGTSHDSLMLIQDITVTISTTSSNQAYLDISFPVAFDATPKWVVGQTVNGNAVGFNVGIYSITSTGCRVYVRHINDDSTTLDIQVQVVACGKKA